MHTNKMFSLDVELVEKLNNYAKEHGEKLSHIVDRALRAAMSMPPPTGPAAKEGMEAIPMTRSEALMLEVLKRRGSGWHTGVDLSLDAGVSFHVGEKSLKALALRGQVWRWGSNLPFWDGRDGGGCWGATEPTSTVLTLIAQLPPPRKPDPTDEFGRIFLLVTKYCQGIDDLTAIRAAWEAADCNVDDLINHVEYTAAARAREAERVKREPYPEGVKP